MVKTLPLLPSDWVQWSWENGNGTASAMLTQRAYDAALNKRLCSFFSRHVWNDMVTKLSESLEYSGIAWDSTYATAHECQMLREDDELTAAMFNAMICNANRLGIFRWNWERKNNLQGFLGRTYMKGYAECGENADLLYGWYIIELAAKINHLIEVLKDDADFAEFAYAVGAISEIRSSIAVPRAGVMGFAKEISAEYLAAVAVAGALPQAAQEKAFSSYKGIVIPAKAQVMKASGKGMSFVRAAQETLKAEAMIAAGTATTISGSVLSDMAFIGRMMYSQKIAANIAAKLEVSNLCDAVAVCREKSKEFAKLTASEVWIMRAQGNGKSYALPPLQRIEGIRLETAELSDSHSMTELVMKDKSLMTTAEAEKSIQNSVLHYLVPLYMKKDIYAVTIPKARADIVMPFPVQSNCKGKSHSESRNDICAANPLEWTGDSETLTTAIVRAMQVMKMTAAAVGESVANGSKVIYCDAVRFETHKKSESKTNGVIQKGIPKIIEAAEIAQTTEVSNLVTLPRRILKANVYAYGKCNTRIEAKQAHVMDAVVCAEGTKANCLLELEYNPKGIWKDPVQNGNNLYIRSVFPQWQEGDNVHVDSGGEFYEPEQKGGNVYIRSNESLKGV